LTTYASVRDAVFSPFAASLESLGIMLVNLENSDLAYKCLTYGDNVLQRVGVWELPNASRQEPSSYWVMYGPAYVPVLVFGQMKHQFYP
jgi:hypothetical protein